MMKTWIKNYGIAEEEREGDLNDVAFEGESKMTPRLRSCEEGQGVELSMVSFERSW